MTEKKTACTVYQYLCANLFYSEVSPVCKLALLCWKIYPVNYFVVSPKVIW